MASAHMSSKRQSLTTVLLRTPITQMIFFNQSFKHWASNKVAKRTIVWLPNTLRLTRARGIWFLTFACPQCLNGELKQPRRRRQQKPQKFAYLTMKNSIGKSSWRSGHQSHLPPLLKMLYVDWVSVDLNLTSRVSSGHSGFLPPQNWLLVYSSSNGCRTSLKTTFEWVELPG